MLEQRDGDAFHAETDAGRMRAVSPSAVFNPQVETEMVLVVVEAQAGGRVFFRIDRHQQFELQAEIALARRHDAAGATEERIVGDVDVERQFE